MILIDRIKEYGTYRYYKKYLDYLRSSKIDISFGDDEFFMLPDIFNEYINFITLPKELDEDEYSEEELDSIVIDKFLSFFDDEDKKILIGGLETKNIIDGYPTCTTNVDSRGFYMLMNQYKYISDLANFMHEIMHVFIYRTNNPHINSEVLSIAFELIARDIVLGSDKVIANHVNTLLDSMLANIRLLELYNKITPVILPYIKAEYLSYEIYLLYKSDPEKFIYHLRKLLNSEISIEDYLLSNNIQINRINFKKIEDNHKKILTKQ